VRRAHKRLVQHGGADAVEPRPLVARAAP
jgi:hypothetical protein